MECSNPHTSLALSNLQEFHSAIHSEILLNGYDLTIPKLYAICKKLNSATQADPKYLAHVKKNADYLSRKVNNGAVIYGVNTGYGGSADVRSKNLKEVQSALIRHLNAGFSSIFNFEIPRGVMAVRANSLCRAMSGVRPEVIQLLLDMLNKDIIPEVPVRGSVSASGDLMPTSYIAAAMMGREDARVRMNGQDLLAPEALQRAGLKPITFAAKEALAVVNSCSFSVVLAANVLQEANKALLLTQVSKQSLLFNIGKLCVGPAITKYPGFKKNMLFDYYLVL